ncbi:MAG: pesticin C-terminus-like muramidase [Desulfovibrionaceae bacterium]|nr:pesticin C-terminus-like muramidase [Desulfovibrionaceae bacterium]
MKNIDKIESFLETVEGERQTVGYIPCFKKSGGTANYKGVGNPVNYVPMGASGVTIATGVDLGQTDMNTLRSNGVPLGIINPLIPYIGKRKAEALEVLHRIPLTVSPAVAETLDHCMHKYHLNIISARYDREAGKGAFDAAPWQVQAVIYSLLYQHGTSGMRKFPKTWRFLVAGQWEEAARELCSTNWSEYIGRRNAEGKLLLGAV